MILSPDSLTQVVMSSAGGFFTGVLLGYFVKKIVKIILFITCGIVGLLLYLQQQQIISLNIERLEDSSAFILTSIVSSFNTMTQIGDTTSLGIPLTASLTAGFTVGLMKS